MPCLSQDASVPPVTVRIAMKQAYFFNYLAHTYLFFRKAVLIGHMIPCYIAPLQTWLIGLWQIPGSNWVSGFSFLGM
jgi:hypothetical protein